MNMKLTRLAFSALCIFIMLTSLGGVKAMPVPGQTRGGVLYVKPIAKSGDCSSWDTACELQAALARAAGGDEIWVMTGTYKPTLINDRSVSFVLVNGVALYGGFAGTETEREERDWLENPTILSGDIGTASDNSDNSYHVVYGTGLEATTILDGFTITDGNANGTGNAASGGGMYTTNSSPKLTNVTFLSNTAIDRGGGMYNDSGSAMLTNVTFSDNYASIGGGGMYNISGSSMLTNVTFSGNHSIYGYGGGMVNVAYSNPTLTNVTFSSNSAHFGGGMYNGISNPTLTNVTFFNNSSGTNSDVMYNQDNSNAILTNAILWGAIANVDSIPIITYSLTLEDYSGEGNISDDPRLDPLADNGGFTQTHALLPGSPAIDSGSPTVCPATDQRGYLRPIDGNGDGTARCDMGAYEYGSYLPYYNYLPLILKPSATIPDPILNGNFEDGKTGWTESATTTRDLIVNSGFPAGVTPHSGLWAAWLGGDALEDISTISQYVSIPAGRSMLHFWYWISAPADCGHDFLTLSVGSDILINWDLCVDSQTGGWVEHTIDLSAYAGSSAWINLSVAVDDADTSQVFIDDVSFEIH